MWIKLALGACAGLLVGHFAKPGYTLWLIAGTVAAYAADVWHERSKVRRQSRVEM